MENNKKPFEKKGQRKRQIALSGLRVFCEKGYDNTTVDDIVKKANCSHGLFYHYYKTKKELFDEVMRIKAEHHREDLIATLNVTPNYNEKLRVILGDLFNTLVNDEDFTYYFYFFITQKFINKQKGISQPKKPSDKKFPFLLNEQFFEEGQKQGYFTDKYSAKDCVKLFFSIIQGATIGFVIAPKEIQKEMKFPNVDFIISAFKKETHDEK